MINNHIKSIRIFLLIFLPVLWVCAQEPQQLPPPPPGFQWQWLAPIKGALLKPAGWHYKEVKEGGADAFFVSKERIESKKDSYRTGLSLNCIRDLQKKRNVTPSAFAAQFVESFSQTHPPLERKRWKQGAFDAFAFLHVDSRTPLKNIKTYHLLIANDGTGALYIAVFEAPESSWNEDYAVGETILKNMLLDDGI
ncbi:MAG: hypothetical protein LBI02_03650 [Opitutaceae bacterium]|jgi:hypothetical protein|nr:hypothetical protein [Opitutaceae bacterium]